MKFLRHASCPFVEFKVTRNLDNDEEKLKAVRLLGNRYNPNDEEALAAEIRKSFKAMCMIELDIEHITGKEAIELVKMHK